MALANSNKLSSTTKKTMPNKCSLTRLLIRFGSVMAPQGWDEPPPCCAVQLTAQATPFALRTADNHSLGAVRSTSIYLRENGSAGTVQQIDLSV